MSTSATGKLVDENGMARVGLRVFAWDESGMHEKLLAKTASDNNGAFTLQYEEVNDLHPNNAGTAPDRKIFFAVQNHARRLLLGIQKTDNKSLSSIDLGTVTIPRPEERGYVVTLGGSGQAAPVRDGNAVRPLIDDHDAWSHLADKMNNATESINLMELEFDVPPQYKDNPDKENPEIVLAFGKPEEDEAHPRAVNSNDSRPERILIDRASKKDKIKVRVSVPHPDMTHVSPILLPLVLFLTGIAYVFFSGFRDFLRGFARTRGYFEDAKSNVQFASFATAPFNVLHAKAAIVDDEAAVVIGSPLNQAYWDTHAHYIFEPGRGSDTGEPVPVHDVSLGVRGPAVKDLHDSYRLFWNFVKPGDLPEMKKAPDPIQTPEQDEYRASLQLVRTLNGGVFPAPLDKGEQGNLEAYLRAIGEAERYIYLENQYFTNRAISMALVDALNDKDRPSLQIIVMLNVNPDMPFYSIWQYGKIRQIQKDAGSNASRIAFFTAWSHEKPDPSLNKKNSKNPMIAPNYLHTKVGIVDDKWATVGSANLDGSSLDYTQLLHPLQFGDHRNYELNYLIFNGVVNNVDGSKIPETDAVAALRKSLWHEHLGMDATDPLLDFDKNSANWLELWKKTAEKKRLALISAPDNPDPKDGRVLQVPSDMPSWRPPFWPSWYSYFLKRSQISLDKLDLIEKMRAFNFHSGTWEKWH